MFVFNRSGIAVLLPLALLVAVVLWSNRTTSDQRPAAAYAAAGADTESRARVDATTVARLPDAQAPKARNN